MNLLFDLNATQPNPSGKYHGGGKYAEVVFFRMIERGIKFSCFYDSRKWLNPVIANACKANMIPLFDIQYYTIANIVKENHIDQIYSALPSKDLSLSCPCEIIGTIHGLRIIELKFDVSLFFYKKSYRYILSFFKNKLFLRQFRKKFITGYAGSNFNIITVSQHSKYSILTYFPELRNKDIKVLYSPNTSKNTTINTSVHSITRKYFFVVSANRWDKNNLRALIAFDRLLSQQLINNDIVIKITGAEKNIYRYKLQNPNNFEFLGYVDENELENLYSQAYLFIYPSLNEGFGYPPIEAMKYHVPVIASPFTSISEICGNGALYFNPYSIEEIMNRMLMMMDPNVHLDYSNRGFNRYKEIKLKQDGDLDKLIDTIIKKDK